MCSVTFGMPLMLARLNLAKLATGLIAHAGDESRFNLGTVVGRARVGRHGVGCVGVRTLQANARTSNAPDRTRAARSGV